MPNKHHPFHPVIYVRGFAATPGEIEDTVSDPYMGFNLGATKTRALWSGDVKRFYFESPLLRIINEFAKSGIRYDDVYFDGVDQVLDPQATEALPYQSIVIFRYYDEASTAFSDGKGRPIEHFAQRLSELILKLRDKLCGNKENDVAPEDFRVYLIAHSMGGLICRAFLQNPANGSDEARKAVDKLFTYATPHNGIDLRIVGNVPGWVVFGDVNNFNREKIAEYMGLKQSDDVAQVTGFDINRIFNLVGTNPADYLVLSGISRWAAGPESDGLVRMENATTHDEKGVKSPSAYVYRSHSGYYGIVNSEEGYQNMIRFFFGDLRVDGYLDVNALRLPADVQDALNNGKRVKASYQFEVVATARGCQWQMHRRVVRENSAIFRQFDELMPQDGAGNRVPDHTKSPHLFSIFLDSKKSTSQGNGSLSFAFDLSVVVPDYEVDGILFLKHHYEGSSIYRDRIIIEAFPPQKPGDHWKVLYGFQSKTPNAANEVPDNIQPSNGTLTFEIPISQPGQPGIDAKMRIIAARWNGM